MAAHFTKCFLDEVVLLTRNLHRPLRSVTRCYNRHRSIAEELFPQRLVLPENHGYVPILTPTQISTLLSTYESEIQKHVVGQKAIKGFDTNELGSNSPIEDRRAQARLVQTNGALFAVFDGHGGCACAQAVKERLFNYIAVSLLPTQKLEELNHAMKTDTPMDICDWHFNANCYFNEEMSMLHRASLQKYIVESLSIFDDESEEGDKSCVARGLRNAFMRLDNDLSTEAQPVGGAVYMEALEVALSGACACVAHIDGLDLHVANVGDARAVIGQTDGENWTVQALTTDHCTSTESECERVKRKHPSEERTVIRNSRLLGQLIPLRAFGDMRYKWSVNDLKSIVNILDTPYARNIIPPNYYTPPYLTCEPEITHYRLTPKDKFLVIASDGLWEQLSDEKVVKIVGAFLEGKETADRFRITRPTTLGELNEQLQRRKVGLANKTEDCNVATHLLRHALGHEHHKVSDMLTLPSDLVRYYRDDITITVVFFDSDHVGKQYNEH